MRSLILILIFLSSELLFSQVPQARRIPVRFTGVYHTKTDTPFVFVPSGFAVKDVAGGKTPDSLKGHVVYQIVLAYSQYKHSKDFDQGKLNADRWNKLHKTHPELFSNEGTSYVNVCQTSAVTDSAARLLDHGFFIYYRKPADPDEREKEIDDLSDYFSHLGIDVSDTTEADLHLHPATDSSSSTLVISIHDSVFAGKSTTAIPETPKKKKRKLYLRPRRTIESKVCRRASYGDSNDDIEIFLNENVHLTKKLRRKKRAVAAEVTVRLNFNGRVAGVKVVAANKKLVEPLAQAVAKMDLWNPAIRNSVTVRSEVKIPLLYINGKFKLTGDLIVQKTFQKCECCTPDSVLFAPDELKAAVPEPALFMPSFGIEDSIIKNVVKRNPEMKDLLVVVDLTGSMSPYILQVVGLMEQMALAQQVKCFSLFNDGDSKSDEKKQVGNTGGVYIVHGEITLKELGRTIMKAMRRGSGGDLPENNIEAVLKGMSACPECKEVIMVADNYATPRDRRLVSQIKTPIHWIVCGGENHLNPEYLNLARENKGVLHTLNYDVKDLHLLKEGETVVVGQQTFVLTGGKFRIFDI